MLTLRVLLDSFTGRPDLGALLREFTPPPRFQAKKFDDYSPQHPSQVAALNRLRHIARSLAAPSRKRIGWMLPIRRVARSGRGVYLDGGFGVGKTHLLAALWNASPAPKAYLSFDELMYFIGIVGPRGAAEAFAGYRLVAVDEWELDDPGNLKMAIAFLRDLLRGDTLAAVTSNTLPLELGSGRFSQKDFRAEVEELAAAFEVVSIEGEDYRHRHFEASPGRDYFLDPAAFGSELAMATRDALYVEFGELIPGLGRIHPIRYRELAARIDTLLVDGVSGIPRLPDALRFVHLIDAIYDSGVRMAATGDLPLSRLFDSEALRGPFGKKLSRCLSRLEEMLGASAPAPEASGS